MTTIVKQIEEFLEILGDLLDKNSLDNKIAVIRAYRTALESAENARQAVAERDAEIARLVQENAELRERSEAWDADAVRCGCCDVEIIARDSDGGDAQCLSIPEGEDNALCGRCMQADSKDPAAAIRVLVDAGFRVASGDSLRVAYYHAGKIGLFNMDSPMSLDDRFIDDPARAFAFLKGEGA